MPSSTVPTPATPDVCTAKILVEGTEVTGELHLLALTVSKELNRIPAASLHFQDGEASKSTFPLSDSDKFVPGKKIEIKLGYRAQDDTVFKGIVIRNSIKIRKNGSLLIVECRDEAVKMTTGLRSHFFTDKKDSDIIEEIIGRHGLQKDVETTRPDLKEIVQYEATDWDFVLLRAEANGQVIAVEDGKITVKSPDATAQPTLEVGFGATLLELDAEMDARWQSPGIKTSSWSSADQALVEVDAAEPSPPAQGNLSAASLADVLGSDPHQIRHGGKLTQPELQAWGDGRLLKERFGKVRGRARFQGFAGIRQGDILKIGGIGQRFEGKVLVAGVRHALSNGNWETDVQFGLNPEPIAEIFQIRPTPAAGLLPAIGGLQIGVVTKLEGDPDGEERIQVRLPLVDPQADGIWARLATLDAGQQRGTFFRPELDDEVIVGFLNDDPRHLVILGACHSSAKPAPVAASDDNHEKGYVSREKLKLTFDDDKKVILLETPAGNRMTLSEDAKGIQLEDQNGNKIILDDSGIKIESSKDLSIKAAKDIKIEGMNLSLKAQTAFKAEGSASAEVSGANTTLKGNAATVIQGGVVQIN